MGMYAVQPADDLGEFSGAARNGRAVAKSRRLQMSQGRQALNGAGNGAGAPPAAESRQVDAAEAPPAAPNGQGASSAAEGVGIADAGRAISMQRRRQLSQGKRALNGGRDRTAAAAGAGRPVLIVHDGGAG